MVISCLRSLDSLEVRVGTHMIKTSCLKLSKKRAPVTAAVVPAVFSSEAMAVPPPYADLGKSARDFFPKDYGFGIIRLGLKMSPRTEWNQTLPIGRPPKWTAAQKQNSEGPKWEWPGLYGEEERRQCPGHWGHRGRPSPRDCSCPCIHPSRLKWEGAVLSSRQGTRGSLSTWTVMWTLKTLRPPSQVLWCLPVRVGWLSGEFWDPEVPGDPK